MTYIPVLSLALLACLSQANPIPPFTDEDMNDAIGHALNCMGTKLEPIISQLNENEKYELLQLGREIFSNYARSLEEKPNHRENAEKALKDTLECMGSKFEPIFSQLNEHEKYQLLELGREVFTNYVRLMLFGPKGEHPSEDFYHDEYSGAEWSRYGDDDWMFNDDDDSDEEEDDREEDDNESDESSGEDFIEQPMTGMLYVKGQFRPIAIDCPCAKLSFSSSDKSETDEEISKDSQEIIKSDEKTNVEGSLTKPEEAGKPSEDQEENEEKQDDKPEIPQTEQNPEEHNEKIVVEVKSVEQF